VTRLRRRLLGLAVVAVAASGCAKPRLQLPTGPFEPFPGGAEIVERTFSRCLDLHSISLEIALSGRAGDQRLRGRLLAGFATPGSVRLEALAPFGQPVFILAATLEDSVLLLPRDNRVLRDTPPNRILEALAGLDMRPDELRQLLAGCPTALPASGTARRFNERWIAVDLEDGGVAYLVREHEAWRPAAVVANGIRAVFEGWSGDQPQLVRLDAASARASSPVHIALRLSQVERNVSLPPRAFTVNVPADAEPISIEELRRSGPMRDTAPPAS
jgi:hypothetical protein